MVRRDKTNYVIQSVAHALDVLEQFFGDVDELGVTELSSGSSCIRTTSFESSRPSKRAATSNKTKPPRIIASVSSACISDAVTSIIWAW